MKTKSNVWVCIFALAAGILLLIFNNRNALFSTLVQIIGIMMVIPSAIGVSIGMVAMIKQHGSSYNYNWTTIAGSALGLIFGICLISMPRVFSSAILYTLAAVMIVAAIIGIITLASSHLSGFLGAILYIVPVLMIIAGVTIIIIGQPHLIDRTAAIITGAGLICYSINGFVAMIGEAKMKRYIRESQKSTTTDDIW
ncbi:MAG: DUF308 domain-containing protein [Muribaculaceae bacterium]|nr:DUF308 domain-containing protein [Muribaculaceae bacterium]